MFESHDITVDTDYTYQEISQIYPQSLMERITHLFDQDPWTIKHLRIHHGIWLPG